MSIIYRLAQAKDISAIAKVQHESQFSLEFNGLPPQERLKYILDYKDLCCVWHHRLLESIKPYKVMIAYDKDNDYLCGFISYTIVSGIGYIGCFYISSDYINQGIGSKFLEFAQKDLFDRFSVLEIRLEVFEKNLNAISFYENRGFERTDYVFPKALGTDAQEIFGTKYKVYKYCLPKDTYLKNQR